jgi:hypothetical protein
MGTAREGRRLDPMPTSIEIIRRIQSAVLLQIGRSTDAIAFPL